MVVVFGVVLLPVGLLPVCSGVPTLDDARVAADALLRAGVGEVWLYGSVARGESRRYSDIDLVAVFDDLDYRQRLSVTMRLLRAAEQACGRRVEVLVTDRAEWRVQHEDVSASFVSAISCDLVLLACSPDPPGEVDWSKKQVMATSNEELALERLQDIITSLGKILANLDPGGPEHDLAHGDDRVKYERVRGCRMIVICEAAQLAIENAAKAFAILGGVPAQTLWTHNIAELVDSLDWRLSRELRTLLLSAPELIKHEGYITMWRIRGAYGTHGEGLTAQEIATPTFAAAMARIACDTAECATRTLHHQLSRRETTEELAEWARTIRQRITDYDITTGHTTTTTTT